MTKILNHINTYADLTAYNNDTNKDYPNVSYIVEDDIVLFDNEVKYEEQYFTIESLEDDNEIMFKLKVWTTSASPAKTISVSTDGGKTWTNYTSTTGGTTIATLNKGEKILIKGNNNNYYDNSTGYNHFTANKKFDVNGNIMSLIYGDDFKEQYSFPTGTTYNFDFIFDSAPVVSAENLILPATTLATHCYQSMFGGCTSLTTAPVLPATTLATHCYQYMFQNCTSLTTAPELPATTLASYCYSNMFGGCTSLTTAPELPATTLASYCYQNMFYGCSNLNYIKAMFTTTPSSAYTSNWVVGVASSGTFVKNSDATWNVTGTSGVPSGWTVVTE